MVKIKFKYFLFSLLTLLVLGLIITIKGLIPEESPQFVEGEVPVLTPVGQTEFTVNEIGEGIPESLRPCLPENFAQASLRAKSKLDGDDIYSVLVTVHDDSSQPLILVKDGECKILNPRKDNSDVPLSSVIEPELAKEIAIQRYQRVFEEMGGKEEFQNLFNEEVNSGEEVFMPQENYDALIELGIEIPDNVQPIQSITEVTP